MRKRSSESSKNTTASNIIYSNKIPPLKYHDHQGISIKIFLVGFMVVPCLKKIDSETDLLCSE